MSDFQYLQKLLNELMIDEFTEQDGHTLGPAEIHEYLSQVMYARRTKMNPLWNSLVVGGFKDGKRCVTLNRCQVCGSELYGTLRFLAYVDLLGTTYKATTIATGYGAYIAQPLLRKAVEPYADVLKEEQAQKILEDCMRVLFYRDARSLNKASTFVKWFMTPLVSCRRASSKLLPLLQKGSRFRNHVNLKHHGDLQRELEGMVHRRNDRSSTKHLLYQSVLY